MFKPISRRTVLRGLGTSMALPWLESMSSVYGADKLSKPPVRTAFMFMPNGVWPKDWTPKGSGEKYNVNTPFLSHLRNVKDDFILMENLWNKKTVGRNGHWPKVPAFLGGGFVVRTTGRNMDVGQASLDQELAKHIGHKTPLPSLELSVDEPRTGIDNAGGGFARIYGNHISWRDTHTPVASERIPLMAFNRLFKSGPMPQIPGMKPNSPAMKRSMAYDDSSILDLVRDDAKSLQRKISINDREKVDEYFESVRAVERQIQNSMTPQKRWVNEGRFELTKPEAGIPKDHETHLRLMLDIMLLAFWTDSTRISSFMFGNAQSGKNYSFLPGVKGSFHGLSHHREDPKVLKQYNQIIHFHMKQVAYVLEKMKSMNEGGSSLLDNSMVLFGSTIKDGNKHHERDLPIILAGKGGGAIRSGRRITSAKETPLCNLYMSMSDIMGVKQKAFGDSTGKIDLT
ncbi:MAG: DUF1552 domain-containing protein [Lentisphaeraceae bacterium]|nr:DUF1552 domain-containing protein [Lentisphaeraceae bacterium]